MEKKDFYAQIEEAQMTLCDVIKRFGEKAETAEEVEALAAVSGALSKLLQIV